MNSTKRIAASAIVFVALIATFSRADTIFLTSGAEVNGTIESEDGQVIVIRTRNGSTRSIRKSNIDTIVRDAEKEPRKAAPIPTPSPVVPVNPPDFTRPIAPRAPANDMPAATATIPKAPAASAPDVRIVAAGVNDTKPQADRTGNPTNLIPDFPPYSKRMSKRKEQLFLDSLENIKTVSLKPDDTSHETAIADIQSLGSEAMPYLWAGVQDDNGEVRSACMRLIGQMNGRTCIKRVIETFYMSMPEASPAAASNVPLITETIKTVAAITGQTYIIVDPRRQPVQDGLKKYVEWYNLNFKNLPRQIGEAELDGNDPDYERKLTEARKLQLTKKEWPRPSFVPTDAIAGPNKNAPPRADAEIPADASNRPADKEFGKELPLVQDANALKRPQDTPGVLDDNDALKRPNDKRNDAVPNATQNASRDPVAPIPDTAKDGKAIDPFKRPQDALKDQNQQ